MKLSFYQNPVVRDRLINYYAADEVFNRLVGYYASDPVYKDIADAIKTIKEGVYAILPPELDALRGIAPTLEEFNDVMAGKIISDYFGKVTDLVGGHANLTWYATPEVVSSAYGLFSRGENIAELMDFSMGTTPTGASRWDRLQNYLNDALYSSLEWYSRGDVIGALTDRINLRFGDIFRIQDYDFMANPSARGPGGRMLVHDFENWLTVNFGGDFAGTRLGGALTEISGRLSLRDRLEGPTFEGIRDRLKDIQDTLDNSIATLGDRDTPGTTFGDLFRLRQEFASFIRTSNTGDLRDLCDVLLGIDEIVNTMGRVRDRIRSIIADHFTPW